MDETKKEIQSDAIPEARFRDPRPSDIDIFYALMPGVLGALAAKSPDANSANAMALMMVREMLGQLAMMGILRPDTRCVDGSPLAAMPNQGRAPVGAAPPVSMYPNQPGMGQSGGAVQQYPTYGAGPSYNGGGRGPVPGQTANIQPVAMFPTQNPPSQL